ncbi:hypothetical protein [Myceligenerans xiligouense]|uniref:Uncharacterized protein n=1 Tax=Myceligenerans xiligouense TaxID=253184 RepID=A0A3N4ZFV8_9MICO|nr:hypothetical protein [Myceligenerans xiligouense]RPF19695.1 hypothetical protein EDD34_0258 [Myceligenerans xiligouense]
MGWVLAVVIVAPVVTVIGYWIYLSTPENGDRIAREQAAGTAAVIADEVVVPLHNSNGVLDAEQIAESALLEQPDPRLPDQRDATVAVELLGWDGATDEAEGARVDLRVEVVVHGGSDGALFARQRTGGHTVECYRLTVGYYEYDEAADLDTIDCPADGGTPEVPAGMPAELGPEVGATTLQALDDVDLSPYDGTGEGIVTDDIQQVMWEAFSSEEYEAYDLSIRVGVLDGPYVDGDETIVAAVGLSYPVDCVVGVKEPGRPAFVSVGYPAQELEIGGLGCSPQLVERYGTPEIAPEPTATPSASPGPTPPWKVESASSAENEKRLLSLLSEVERDLDETDVLAALEKTFPDHTVDVRRDGNELAASVMGPGHRDCLVGVRVGDGVPFRYTDFPRVQLELGELGCVPGLYWSNVTAH